jgi:hypothetical protein
MDANALDALDSEGYQAEVAVAYDRGPPGSSLATPHAFVFRRGVYWVKRQAQEGLVAELVAGRVGSRVGASPEAIVVEVPSAALPRDGRANHLEGVGVATADVRGAENLKDVAGLAPSGTVDPAKLEPVSLALVVAFQTWIGAEDAQVLVDFRTGRTTSIDHGTYRALTAPADLSVVVTTRLPADRAREEGHLHAAVDRIKAVTDEELLSSVSRMPNAAEWRAERHRRIAIAEALASRRDKLEEVMARWSK